MVLSVLLAFKPEQTGMPFQWIGGIKINAKHVQTDNLGNIYAVSTTNQLTKYSRNGNPISTLNYNYTGNITQLDVTNPMQVFVFYRELNKVVVLDNNLAFRGEINLHKAGVIQAATIARSFDNQVWVFDMGDLQLKKIGFDNTTQQSSGNVRQYIDQQSGVCGLVDNGDNVFVVDSLNGVLLFDVFANYQKTIPLKGVGTLKVLDRFYFYYANGKLYRYNWQTAQMAQYPLPDTTQVRGISIEKERIYLHKSDSIVVYSY